MRSDIVKVDEARLVSGSREIGSGVSNFKVSVEKRRCLASLWTLNGDVFCHDSNARRSISYQKLPQLQNLKLSVLKLDGSSFEVCVVKNATIKGLKMAIEEVFGSSQKEGQEKISWSLVWGHFCLCYEGQKLINDKAQIRNYGIKEGDQLQFIRHMSVDYSPFKTRPRKKIIACRKNFMLRSSGSNACEEMDQIDMNACNASNETDRGDKYKYRANEDEEENQVPRFNVANFFRGLLSYSKLWGSAKTGSSSFSSHNKTMRPTRFYMQLLRT